MKSRIPEKERALSILTVSRDWLGFDTYEQLKGAHLKWIDSAIQEATNAREGKWSQSIAVGSEAYIKKIKEALEFRARERKIRQGGDSFELRETLTP